MSTSEYFATMQYRQNERELVRDLERRRILAERRIQEFNHARSQRGIKVAVASWIGRLHIGTGHQTARS
ncbi:MAG: hypothetical protein ABIR57_04825 [Aeromicrobium sp.]